MVLGVSNHVPCHHLAMLCTHNVIDSSPEYTYLTQKSLGSVKYHGTDNVSFLA